MIKLLLFFIPYLVFNLAYASFFQADLKSPLSDPSKGTHLIVTGFGGPPNETVGDQWLTIAHTQALIFKDKSIHGRIRLIGYIDNPATFKTKLVKWNYENIVVTDQLMTGPRLVQMIGQNDKIASIDFIGHNGAFFGFALESYSHRFYLNDVKAMAAYKNKFTADSYIRIMGCNTGWYLAPFMSETLGVPTTGTFTFADIQDLFTPMTWYYSDVGRYPVSAKIVSQNNLSFSTPTPCTYSGGCKRLKVVSIAYDGQRGRYIGTLPFAKYFCGSMNMNDCARRAALSMITNISTVSVSSIPSLEKYAQAVADHMCNSWQDLNRRKACALNVTNHIIGSKSVQPKFTSIDEKMLTCTFKGCPSKVTVDNKGQNILTGIFNQPSTAFKDELDFYKLGFSLL